ncbi:LysM domain protein [Penicillium canariense]|uniref:LysM domain protein n=1 Tax=Penicillium canariense TaxID=189055 RepID=A0A9W9HU97_9EURO|nr:LysM domain protein [Penicillium canariense]KAJ5153569.1 LysM domain protein [Penicillium canariense]
MPTSRIRYISTALGLLFAVSGHYQQLSDAPSYINYPGLSEACLTALNTTVSCPPFLNPVSASREILDSDLVTELCVDSCYTSLDNARDTIQEACTASSDVIVHNNIVYPATFIIDNYLYTYNVSCRKDRSSAAQLNNPLGYDANLASQFASLTSSYNATGKYPTTSPTSYAMNATATTTKAPTTTTPVTSYLYCQNFASAVNSTLYVPLGCETRVWQASDSCESVVSTLDRVTVPQFLAWNPNFNSLYQNSVNFVNYVVCVSPPSGYLNSSTTDTANSPGSARSATTALPVPINAMNGSNTDCRYWYTFSLSLEDFYFLNLEIDANCTNLWLGEAYCVAPVGTITSYSGYPVTTPWISITSATFPSVTVTMSTPTTGYVATRSVMPTASGTLSNYTDYRNYDSASDRNNCSYVAFAEAINLSDFLDWNPSLPSTDCILQAGGGNDIDVQLLHTHSRLPEQHVWLRLQHTRKRLPRYVGRAASVELVDGIRLRRRALPEPVDLRYPRHLHCVGPTQTDTVAGCNEFYTVADGDGCDTIENEFGITFTQFYAWNPSVEAGDSCAAIESTYDVTFAQLYA